MNASILSNLIIILIFYFKNVSAYRILCVFPTISPSHFMVFEALTKGLAEKGHFVTVLTSYPSKPVLNNYREISISSNVGSFVPHLTTNTGSLYDLYSKMDILMDMQISLVNNTITELHVNEIMNEEPFDLVIVETLSGTALLGLGAHFKCPTATFVSFAPWHSFYRESGNLLSLPYISHSFLGLPHPLSFKSRVLNMLLYMVDIFYLEPLVLSKHRTLYEKYFPTNQYPTIDEMIKNVSVYFIATHFSEGNSRPLTPSVVQISGIHINDKSDPLPNDLQKWMDDSKNGVIYFSLGSNMQSSSLPEQQVKNILNGFSELKQNILWKFENNSLPFLPKNVRIEKWFPQKDLLQHKNVKLFITHGGWGSITEAKFHGVPLLIIPLFGDQMANAEKVVDRGWGIHFPFNEIGGDLFQKSINTILTNPKYAEQAKYESMLYRDRQNTPLETAIYWVEYVIRHQGANHLQSRAIYLNFWQLCSLDVILFLFLIVCLIILCFYKLVNLFIKKCICHSKKLKTR